MKLTLRTVEYTATRPSMNLRYGRRHNIVLHKKGKNYEVTIEGKTVEELQAAANDVVIACKRADIHLAPVVTEDMLNGPREPIEGWECPDISGLRQPQLRALCEELEIEHDDRLGTLGLKAALTAYFTGQEAFYRQFQTEGKKPPMPPKSIKEMQAMAKAQDEQETKKEEAEKPEGKPYPSVSPLEMEPKQLETLVEKFTAKNALIVFTQEHTGTKLDKRRALPTLRKNALKALSMARIKAKGSTV